MDAALFDPSLFAGVWAGLSSVLSPELWLLVLTGVFLGMTVGVLPGFGPPAAVALLFPLVYVLDPLPGISLLSGHLLRRQVRRRRHLHTHRHSGRGRRRGHAL